MNDHPTSLRIIHVALFTRNPRDRAPFYRDAFGMKIVHVGGAVQLWDGHILLALNPWRGVGEEKLRIDEVGEPQAKGFDHFGYKIEDLEETKGLLKKAGSNSEVMKRPAGRTFTEWRAHDLEGNRIDLSEKGYKPVSAEKLQQMEVEVASEINRIVIGSENPARLAEFYKAAFGMEISYQSEGKFTLTDGRMHLLLLARGAESPSGFHCLGFRLLDERRMLQRASELGASVSRASDWENSEKHQYLFRDPDGNLLALFGNGG
jgi:catechol 2,3-dioxygenase-like lactoylglutathione lyase family enzyme